MNVILFSNPPALGVLIIVMVAVLFLFIIIIAVCCVCITIYTRHRARRRRALVAHTVVATQPARPVNTNIISGYPEPTYTDNPPFSTSTFAYPNVSYNTRGLNSFNAPPSYDETTALPPVPRQPSAPPVHQV